MVHRATAKRNLAKNLALLLPSGCDADSKYSTIFFRSTRTRLHGVDSSWDVASRYRFSVETRRGPPSVSRFIQYQSC